MGALSAEETKAQVDAVPYWFHRIDVGNGIVTPGEDDTPAKFKQLGLQDDLRGVRILDVGAYDGYFSFECERRGAEVLAVDLQRAAGFDVARRLLGSHVEHREISIYDLSPATVGTFDLVLCLGVIYHLMHPMLGLERVAAVSRGAVVIETQVCDGWFIKADGQPGDLAALAPTIADLPLAQFYPGAELNGDPSNWWSPNVPALLGMVAAVGLTVERLDHNRARAWVFARRRPGSNGGLDTTS
jgi:tRNA (mo5U34)-methyltransferase